MADRQPDDNEPRSGNGALIGVAFAIVLVLGAIWLMDRMRFWASLGDCAVTHDPRCRELIGK